MMYELTKLKPKRHRVYATSCGNNMVWLPDSVSLFCAEPRHVEVLGLFQQLDSPEKMRSILETRTDLEIHKTIEELLEAGALADGEESSIPLQGTFTPIIDAFRVVMTEACNFRCPGCFATSALRDNSKKLRTMSLEVVEKVFSTMLPFASENEVLVHFFGGEPLLAFPQIKRAVSILEHAWQRRKILKPSFAITTNGSIVNDEIIDFFVRHNFEVGVSIEGGESLHNTIRVLSDGGGTFSMVADNYRRMQAAGVALHVLFTPYGAHQHNMPVTLRFLAETFPSNRITINTAFEKHTLAWDVDESYAEQLLECERVGRELGMEIDSALTPLLAAISQGVPRISPQATAGGHVMVSIDPEGQVFRSSQKWSADLKIGSLEEVRNSEMKSYLATECLDCEARQLCGGPNEEFKNTTGKLLDEAKCRFHKRALQLIAESADLFSAED